MALEVLGPGVRLERADRWTALVFDRPRPVLSSAPVGGGDTLAQRVVNLCVGGAGAQAACDDPTATFAALAADQGWRGPLVGLMTGVAAHRAAVAGRADGADGWAVLASAGVSNGHRAGHPAPPFDDPGTINVIAVTDQGLTGAARAEALGLVAEAKAALLGDLGIRVPGGERVASGTGTDAVAIVAGGGDPVAYTGHHTASGQNLAGTVRAAIGASLAEGEGGVARPC